MVAIPTVGYIPRIVRRCLLLSLIIDDGSRLLEIVIRTPLIIGIERTVRDGKENHSDEKFVIIAIIFLLVIRRHLPSL